MCAVAQPGICGSFEVNPIRVDLAPQERSSADRQEQRRGVRRSAGAVLAWSQQDGRDVLSPTNEVLVSPPIATIAPDKEQIIRVGLRRAPIKSAN